MTDWNCFHDEVIILLTFTSFKQKPIMGARSTYYQIIKILKNNVHSEGEKRENSLYVICFISIYLHVMWYLCDE